MKAKEFITAQIKDIIKICRESFTPLRITMIIIGVFVVTFGLYNIHDQTKITEGGILGFILLFEHWFGMKASVASPILNALCYIISAKTLGKRFIIISVFSLIIMAVSFKIIECFPPVIPNLSDKPLLAAVVGALFIGVGAGIVIKFGGTTSGDDALALFISKKTDLRLNISYLATDLTVLALSLTYIPLKRILYSVITVTLSSEIIDLISRDWSKNGNRKKIPHK